MKSSIPFVLLWWAVAVAGCGSCEAGSTAGGDGDSVAAMADPAAEGFSVLVIVSEALKASTLGCYGYDRPTSPSIDRLAAQGVVFDQYRAASPWTLPSFATMLTGLWPSEHGAGFLKKGGLPTKAKAGTTVLPELLPKVETSAIINNAYLHESYGLAEGFRHYDWAFAGFSRYRDAREVTNRAKELLASQKGRFFTMLHYFDPHVPYRPPTPQRDDLAMGEQGRIKPRLFKQFVELHKGELVPSEGERLFLRGLYDAEVRFFDDQVGLLFAALEEAGRFEDTWIVVTSDHGEEHWEHGGFEHGHRYEDEVTRVPFVVRPPNRLPDRPAGTRISVATSQLDFFPTVLDLFGVRAPDHLRGRSMLPLLRGEEGPHRLTLMEANLRTRQMQSLFDGRYKIVLDKQTRDGFMYDLKQDPGELERLGPGHPEYAKLAAMLGSIVGGLAAEGGGGSSGETPDVPSTVTEALRSLGYIE